MQFSPLKAKSERNDKKLETKTLHVYRDVIIGGLKNHWRNLYTNEISELLNNGNYPFSYSIERNPKNECQAEILITINESTVRIPSDDKNKWIDISG